jgi:hypothetical protein
MTALYIYIGAALLIMLYLGWWLSRHWGPGMVSLVVLLAGALLLTPAYPKEGVDTFAPALIVAAFQWITAGVEGARHALRPLAFMCLVAVVLALLLRLSIFRRGSKQRASRPGKPPEKRAAKA